jgi:hypothetical protein
VHLLDSGVADRDPDGFLIGFEYPCLEFDAVRLDIFMGFNIHLSHDSLPFLEGLLIEGYPDFALWRNQMIEQAQRLPFPTLNHSFPKTPIKKA